MYKYGSLLWHVIHSKLIRRCADSMVMSASASSSKQAPPLKATRLVLPTHVAGYAPTGTTVAWDSSLIKLKPMRPNANQARPGTALTKARLSMLYSSQVM